MPRPFTKENAREMQRRSAAARMLKCSRERRRLIARKATLSRWYPSSADPLKRVEVYLRVLARLASLAESAGLFEEAADTVYKMLPFERYRTALQFRDIRMLEHSPAKAVESPGPENLAQVITQFSPSELLARESSQNAFA